jgi:hypothetical protein
MPTKTSPITQPAPVIDTYSAKGDLVVSHAPEAVQAIRDAAAAVRQRQESGLPPQGSQAVPQAPAPSGLGLPSIQVSRAIAGHEIQRLRALAESGRRDLAGRFTFTASGAQISDPAVIAQRAELAAQVDAAEAEAGRLDGLDDLDTQRWAAGQGWH